MSVTFSNILQSELGLLAADVIHSLRACLDNLVWEITPVGTRSSATAFPIRPTDTHFRRAAIRSLKALPTAVIDSIRSVQPFVDERHGGLADSGGHLLKLLDDFWNDDKHRAPTVAVGTLTVMPQHNFLADTTLAAIARTAEAKREVLFKGQREDVTGTVEVFMRTHIAVNAVVQRVRAASLMT